MFTIFETPLFARFWPDYWTEDERAEFATFLATHPEAGDVVQGSGGVRKVRWQKSGGGKSGGVRVIYYNQLVNGHIWLLTIYGKNVRDTLDAHILRQLKEKLDASIKQRY
jgi:hypothetical protein